MKNLLLKGNLSSWIWKRRCVDQNSFHSSQGWETLKKKMSKSKDIHYNVIIIVPYHTHSMIWAQLLVSSWWMMNGALSKCYTLPNFILVVPAEFWCQKSIGQNLKNLYTPPPAFNRLQIISNSNGWIGHRQFESDGFLLEHKRL